MNKYEICGIVAGVLIVLIGLAVGFGGFQLRNGVPPSWPDVVATDSTARNVALSLAIAAAALVTAGAAATMHLSWGYWAGTIATVLFVAGGFWVNYALFGNLRPIHTGPNVIVGALIVWLLWVGYSAPKG